MNDNAYAEGTLEWYAFDHGARTAIASVPIKDVPATDVISAAWRNVMGGDWNTFTDGDDLDRGCDAPILVAFMAGYVSN